MRTERSPAIALCAFLFSIKTSKSFFVGLEGERTKPSGCLKSIEYPSSWIDKRLQPLLTEESTIVRILVNL